MVPRKIIADSDDEGEDLSPGASPRNAPVQAGPQDRSSSADALANATSSTDSRFFESVYNQQQDGILLHHTIPEELPPLQQEAPEQRLSPPIREVAPPSLEDTDPVPTPTQIATPGNTRRGMFTQDIWDVPSSSEQANSRRIAIAPGQSLDQRASKRRRTDQASTMEPNGSTPETREPGLRGPSSLYIDAQSLSPGRQLLYQSIQLSSDEQTQLHTDPGNAALNASSGSATIAYPTPTQARTFMPRVAESIVEEQEPHTVPSPEEQRSRPSLADVGEAPSSPDVIVTHAVSAAANRAADQSFDEICEPDEGTFQEERYRARPSRRRAAAESMEVPGPAPALFDPGPDSLPPQRRRGRPRKSNEGEGKKPGVEGASVPVLAAEVGPVGTGVPEHQAADDAAAPPAEAAKKEKRKRGRPRKNTPATNQDHGDDGGASNAKRRKREGGSAAPSADAGGEEAEEAHNKDQAPRDQQHPAAGNVAHDEPRPETPLADTDDQAEGTAAPPKAVSVDAAQAGPTTSPSPPQAGAGKETKKPPPKTPASAGKPVYRVGLSKRSRIAPLLKSLPKT